MCRYRNGVAERRNFIVRDARPEENLDDPWWTARDCAREFGKPERRFGLWIAIEIDEDAVWFVEAQQQKYFVQRSSLLAHALWRKLDIPEHLIPFIPSDDSADANETEATGAADETSVALVAMAEPTGRLTVEDLYEELGAVKDQLHKEQTGRALAEQRISDLTAQLAQQKRALAVFAMDPEHPEFK